MLVLASQSPRRKELLASAGIPFIVRPPRIDEAPHENEKPEEYVKRIAEQKALAVERSPDEIVLGADTVVVMGDEILGKPADEEDAARMLGLLSGRRHEVITGICLKGASCVINEWAVTRVWFSTLAEDEIRAYIATREPMDKAGAYAIQGLASKFVERIDGSYSNVVGLPVQRVWRCLKDFET